MNQHNTTSLSVTNNSHEINRIKDHRIISEAFLLKVSECIKIANTIRTDYGIDILETNGSFEITDKVINHLDSLLSTYYQNVNQNNNNNNNNMDSTLNLSEQNDEFQKLNLFYNYSSSVTLLNNDNQIIKTEQFASDIHCIPIKLPAIIEMQLRNNQLLRNTIHNYRRHERYLNLSKKKKISAIKTADEEDILMIEAKPLCLIELNDTFDSSSIILSKTKESLTKLMNQIHNQYKNKSHKKSNNLIANIEPALKFIINEEITYEYLQNEIKINNQQNQSKQLRKKKKNQNQTMQILPYENTYGQFYYTDQFIPIEQTMIDKIVYGVQAMAAALTNTKDIEDVLNGIVMLADQSTSPFSDQTDNKIADELMSTIQKRFLTQKQGYTTNRERVRVRMALNLILADNRLNGKTIISRSESIILSRMIRKIYLCSQVRTLCSYGDVITIINDSDYHQIRFRTYKRMSLSSDEFIEILGEMYSTFYDTIETMKYYLDADDIIDLDTNLIHSSILTSKQIDDMIKYIVREDAIRQLLKLIFDRTRNSDSNIDDEHRQFKLSLPMKLNDLYQTIKKLNAFMSTTQVMVALRKPYLLQLTKRSKIKPITVNDLRAIMSQIWLLPENFDVLISENTITSEILDDFYIDFHAREDIDERLYKICKKIQDHLNLHSCITRVVLKMIAEHFNGTKLTPFLNEFNKVPRFISIIDIFDDLITSGLISTTELLVFSKQDIIIKKSSLLKHFESISFFHKRDADLLAEITLVMREDDLIEYLTQRAMTIKEIYINSILNNDQRRNFITKNLIESTKRLSSLSIHEFIRHFNLDPNCVKIFYWMGLTDENIVKTLIEIKTFVNEYTLDGIYNNFLTRLHDTLESGVYYISTENLINYDQQKEYLTIKQRNNHHSIHQMISENFCKLGCFLTYKQAYILVDYADPEYEHELSSLTTTHDIISQERLKILLKSTNNEINFDELSKIILPKQQVIECKTLLDSFHQRINYRQNRFKRVENLQKLLLSSILIEKFLEMISDLGVEYFTHIELDCLEEIKLIDIGVLAVLLTLPSYNPLIHQHKYEWFRNKDSLIENDEQISNIPPNYLHILDPIIEKYSIFLTTIIIRIISNKERFEKVNEILLSNSDYYLSTEEVLKICAYEQILTYDNIQYICQEIFPTKQISDINDQSHHSQKLSIDMSAENIQEQSNEKSLTLNINQHDNDRKSEGINNSSVTRLDSHETSITLQSIFDCYTRNMSMYTHDSVLRHKMEQTVIITIFDYILHFNHRTMINEQLRQLFNGFKPLAFYKAQLLIEKEIIVIKLLLNIRKQQAPLTIHDLNRYLESYQIPCRLDIVNELCRIKIISQSLANDYTMNQCYELKVTTPEGQAIFLFYMMIKLIQKEGYIDEINVREILNQYQTKNENEKFNIIYKYILRNGFLTIEQLIQSAKDFFLQDYLNEDILKNQSSEYKTVIQEQFLTNILHRKQLTNTQFELALSQNMRRRQVIQTNILSDQIKNTKIAKEKVQRKVDHVLLKKDDNTQSYSKSTPISSHLTYNSLVKQHKSILEKDQQLLTINTNINNDLAPNLRSLRHNYIQAKIPRNQLHLLVEQGGWNHDTYLEFKRELNIIDSDNSLDLIRHITYNISLLIKENGSVTEKPLMKHFQQHSILFHADFQLLLIRYGIVALEDLIDLLIVSKLAKVDEIKSYAKTIFCLNVNKFMEISKSQENALVKKHHVQNNLEKKICITATDLSQLLNHVLKLDRLKRIIDMMATIKNYIHLHPINTFNALKALKLEFDFNNYDMKFLRDLKLLSDTWYKRYLLSQKNETDSRVSEIIDEEQEQEDQNQHKFHSSIDEDFDLDAFNELFETKELQLDISEQQKQAYFEKLKKQKTQLDSSKLKISTDEDSLQLSINLDDFHKQEEMKKDQTRVIEQFFPDASILGPQLLLPYISDDQKRLFIELDFAEEQNIEDYYKQNEREDVTQQMNKYSDITEKESTKSHIKIEEDLEKIPKSIEEQQQSILKLSSDERFSSNEIDKLSIDSQSIKTFERNEEIQQTVEQSSIEKRLSQIKTSDLIPTEEDKTKLIESSTIQILTSEKSIESFPFIDKRVSSLTDESLQRKPISLVLPNIIEDLYTFLRESLQQMTDIEQISLQRNLQLIRLNVNQWFQQTLQYNERISNIIQQISPMDNNSEYFTQHESLTNQLIAYFYNEFDLFHENFAFLSHLNNSKLHNFFQQRINQIENILNEQKNHQELIKYMHKQIIDIEQIPNEINIDSEKQDIFHNLNNQFHKYKNDFHQLEKHEYFEIQPIIRTRLELAIRTLDIDLQLITQIINGKTLTDIIPNKSSIIIKTSLQSIQPIELQIHKDITLIRDKLSTIAINMKNCQTIIHEKKISQDLLRIDINDRFQAIKNEYLEQKINEEKLQSIKINIDKVVEFDQQQIEFIDKLEDIHNILNKESNKIQNNLLNITTARYHSNHPNFPLNAKLKYLPIDNLGNLIEQPLCLVDEQNMSISDELNLIRLPCESDRFHISNDKHELTIVDKNDIPLSEPITFKQLTSEAIEFEYIDDSQQTVQIIEMVSQHPINKSIMLNVKPISFDKLPEVKQPASHTLFVVDNNDQLLSKPIQLLDHTYSSLSISDFTLVTFLYDEKTNEQILLTPKQYLITIQQAEFTSRKFITYIINKDKSIISEPIQISDIGIQIRHSIENTISNRINLFDGKRHELFRYLKSSENKNEFLKIIFNEFELINAYLQDRLDKLKIEEKIIELIIPILDKQYDDISIDQIEYKREQSNMDNLLNTMKSFLELDEHLTKYRKSQTIEPLEIQKLENNLIQQLTQISTQLDDPLIIKQVQNLTNHMQNTQLLNELRPIILSGIKNRAKTIEEKFESLLINIQNKSNQLKQSELIRFEYFQFFNTRFNEEMEHENNIENLYDKIDRMQYDLHQKMADSLETIKFEDLNKLVKDVCNLNEIEIPNYLKTKNEKLIYIFNFILRFLHNELKIIEQYRQKIFDELEQFKIKSIDNNENFYFQQMNFIENEIKINNHKKLLKFIKKFKILLNKLETINEKNSQYDFLYSKFDRLYEIIMNNYQMNLPAKTNIQFIRDTLHSHKKILKKEMREFDITRNELLRKLDVLKKKEELKQRTMLTSITEEDQLSSLRAYTQQSEIEPLNIHHEFYAMKIQQITNDLVSMFHNKTPESSLSNMSSFSKAFNHLKTYEQILNRQKINNENILKDIDDEISTAREYSLFDSLVREQMDNLIRQQNEFTHNKQLIIKIQTILHETTNQFHSVFISNFEQDINQELLQQMKQRAIDVIIQSAQYERLSKRISPNLLVLHKLTSEQELIPSILPCSVKLHQLEIQTSIQQESPYQLFHFQYQSTTNFQKDFIQQISSLDSIDSKQRILQNEINYLHKQYNEAIVIGDFTRQLAAEQIISNKFQMIESFQEKEKSQKTSPIEIQIPSMIDNQQSIEHKKSKTSIKSSKISEKSLDTNQVNEQIHELLINYDTILQQQIQNDREKLSQTQTDIVQIENQTDRLSSTHLEQGQNEIVHQQMIDFVEDLHQLRKSLEKFQQENDRTKQIDIQLQILDKIDQFDNQSIIDHKTENLRKHLHKEQKQQQQVSLILSSDKQTHHDTHIQIVPSLTHLSESPMIVAEENKIKNISNQTTIKPATRKLIPQTDLVEQTNLSLVTTNVKELFHELQKTKHSNEITFESTQQTSDMVDTKVSPKIPLPTKMGVAIEYNEEYDTAETIHKIRVPSQSHVQSNSIVAMNSSLFLTNDKLDSNDISSSKTLDVSNDPKHLSSPLTIVGNVEKYSLIQRNAKDRKVATSTQRSISQSKREYGEVYIRHRFVDVNLPVSNIDKQREKNEEKLREKIKRKTRLVQFEKTKQGNTVIHRQVDLSKRVLLVPQRAIYEENLEPIPPLIHVQNTTNFTFNQTNITPLKSKNSLLLVSTSDMNNKSSDVNTIDYHSQKPEMKLSSYSTTILSPVQEEPEEIETPEDIPFTSIDKDSLTKHQLIDTTNNITELITFDNNEKLNSLQEIPLNLSSTVPSDIIQTVQEASQQKTDENKRVTVSHSSLPNDLSSRLSISQRKNSIISQPSKEQNVLKKKSSKRKHQSVIIKQIEDVELVPTPNDESLSTQAFSIEQENQEIQSPIPIVSDGKVVYHKVGGKMKKKKKKKKSKKIKQTNTNDNRIKKTEKKTETKLQEEPLILIPRKAVPFISATEDKQIDVEHDPIITYKKKKRKLSSKSTRKYSRSRSSSKSKSTTRRKNKSKHRSKKKLNVEEKTENIQVESKSIKNQDAITMHLLNVKRFTVPPISVINFDQTRHKYNDTIEITNEKVEQSRLHFLKPMIKNFELDNNFQKRNKEIQNIDAYDLDKELFDFNNDTKEIDQPAMFTEYIPEFFQKQAEEKQIRRISLTAIKTDENFIKRLAPRVSYLYNGWQPSDTICAHTDEFRPLNKYLMSDISYYFDDDFIDESGLFQNQRNLDKIESRVKQTTQRFRDDYIVKEFFNCWKDYAVEQARIAELRRKRVTIDFREFWFQDAFSDPFYSYFEQPLDYIKKQDNHHQMAYRLHKRLVRTGREQPKETMNNINRSSFLPILFNLPKNNLDRQVSLSRRRQLINYDNNDNQNYLIPLSNLITHHDEILSLIRERIKFLNRTKTYINIHRDELAIKELLLNTSLLQQGTIKDLDKLIIDYYTSVEQQDIKILSKSMSSIVKLPMLKPSSLIYKSNSKSSRQTTTIS